MRQIAPPRRGETALALGGAVIFGLWIAWHFGPILAARSDASAAAGVQYTYRNQPLTGQVVEYVFSMLAVLSILLVFAGVSRALRKYPRALRAVTIAVAVLPLFLPLQASRGAFALGLCLSAGVAALAYPHVAAGSSPLRATAPLTNARFVLLAETLTLAYGAYLVLMIENGTILASLVVLAGAYVAGRLDERDTGWIALGASPVLGLPLLAMVRAPGVFHIGAVVLVAAIVLAVVRLKLAPAIRHAFVVPEWLAAYVAPTALAMIPLVPLALRDIGLNHGGHEAFHLAWLASVFKGKLLGADAGLVHGPLRDYAIALFLVLTKVDYAHVRISFVLVNVIGIGLTLPVMWYAARRNVVLQVIGAYLLLMQSPARTILWYKHMISLGWADVTRTALPMLALYLVVRAGGEPDPKASARRVRAGGLLIGASLLYSQEFGLCAALAVVGLAIVEPIAWRKSPLAPESRERFVRFAKVVAWAAAPVVLLLVIYATKGKAGLLARTAYESIAFPGSGKWGALPFPLDATTIVDPRALLHELWTIGNHNDPLAVFLLPPMVYLMAGCATIWALVAGRWSERESFRAILLGFGLLSYRVSIATPEIWHLLSATAPALVLLIGLVADVANASFLAPRRRLRVLSVKLSGGLVVATAVSVLIVVFGEQPGGTVRRMAEVAAGQEALSRGLPTIVLPRAGDIAVYPGARDLVETIQKRTGANDPIYVCMDIFGGAELYFLADRRNPTRFDTMSEVITVGRQAEVLASLKADPPKVVIGNNVVQFLGADVGRFLDETYGPYENVGGFLVRWKKP